MPESDNVDDIVSAMEEDVVFGVLPPQARLIEERLAERFKAKRHTIREAFQKLEEMGLITRVKNKGAIVNELRPKEVQNIYFMRELLEVAASRITKLPVAPAVTERMAAIQKEHSEAIAAEDFRGVFRLNIKFHAEQYSACDNDELKRCISDYARKAHLVRAVMYGDAAHMNKIVDQHWAIVEAMQGTDNEKLMEIVRAHIWPSSDEYARLYRIRHGGTLAAAAPHAPV